MIHSPNSYLSELSNYSNGDYIDAFCLNEAGGDRRRRDDSTAIVINASSAEGHDEVFQSVMNVYVVGALCCFGFVGNFASLLVLRHDKRDANNATTWLLQALAVADSFYLVFCLCIYLLKTIQVDRSSYIPGYLSTEPYLMGFLSVAHMLTVWTVMLVTADRFSAVCLPMNAQLRSLLRARVAFAAVVVLSLTYNLPVFLELESVPGSAADCQGDGVSQTRTTKMRRSAVYFVLYKTVCYAIFRSVGPLIIIITLNIRLTLTLRRLNRRRLNQRRHTDRDNLTAMIVAVVSVFVVCQCPDVFLRIFLSTERFYPSASNARLLRFSRLLHVSSNALLTLNSSVNFLVYCMIGKKFRRIFLEMFLRRNRWMTSQRQQQPITVLTEFGGNSSTRNLTSNPKRRPSCPLTGVLVAVEVTEV